MYLDLAPESLPPGWRRDVKVSLTLVKKGLAPQSLNQTLGDCSAFKLYIICHMIMSCLFLIFKGLSS